jgi:shikimate 5-dehydrogenase
VQDGTSMLIHQALKQFRSFTGKAPFKDDAAYLKSILSIHSHIAHGK